MEEYFKDFLDGMKIDQAYVILKDLGFSPQSRLHYLAGLVERGKEYHIVLEEKYGAQIQIAPGAWTTTRIVDVESIRIKENK